MPNLYNLSYAVHTDSISEWTVFFVFRLIGKLLYLLLVVGIVLWFIGVLKSNADIKDIQTDLHINATSDSDTARTEAVVEKDAILVYIKEGIFSVSKVEDVVESIRNTAVYKIQFYIQDLFGKIKKILPQQ